MTPETTYWITILGIFACGILLGIAGSNLAVIWNAQEEENEDA